MKIKEYTKIEKKKGISLVVLLMTIIVALILLTASTVSIVDAADNATISAFAEELKTLEDTSKEYYLQNNQLPVIDTNQMTRDEVLALNIEDNQKIAEEMDSNFDNQDTTNFYKIDLSKLDVTTISRGVLKDGNSKDIYILAYPSFRVYYVAGVEAKNNKFFSLSSKMNGINAIKVDLAVSNSDTSSLQTLANVTVKKDTEEMTNKMGVTITATIADKETEKVMVKINNVTKDLGFVNGVNSVKIDSENDILTTDIEKNSFNSLPADQKYLEVIKLNNNIEVAKIKVDLKNYDNSYPTIVTEPNIKANSTNNILYFDVADIPIINDNKITSGSSSGVKEVRYDYLEKFDEKTFTSSSYYTNLDLNDSYMKGEAKKADISSSSTVRIELPKEVSKIRVLVIDNVSNYKIYDLDTFNDLYINYNVNSVNTTSFDFNLKFYSNEPIKLGNVAISSDNQNYSYSISFSDIKANSLVTKSFVFNDVTLNGNYVYIKVTYTSSTGEETKVFKYSKINN